MKRVCLFALVLAVFAMSLGSLASPIIVGGSYAAAGAGQLRSIEAAGVPDFVILPVVPGRGGNDVQTLQSPIIVGGS